MKQATPAQQQYIDMKKQHPDCVLLFRLGDFYELFHEDAHIAHRVLGITLTARDKQSLAPIPMAGIPYHALEKYLPKLIHAGYKVAIADQVGEVLPGKLVHREITQIITPGTWAEAGSSFCYLVAAHQSSTARYVARGDLSLGIWMTRSFESRDMMMKWLMQLTPREIIFYESVSESEYLQQWIHDHIGALVTTVPGCGDVSSRLLETLHVTSLDGYGVALSTEGLQKAYTALVRYIKHIGQPFFLRRIEAWHDGGYMHLDHLTIKNLELFQGSYQGDKKHSIYAVINTCRTAMGSRLLTQYLQYPLQEISQIQHRQEAIQYRYDHLSDTQEIVTILGKIYDLPRYYQKLRTHKNPISIFFALREQMQLVFTHPVLRDLLKERCGGGYETYDNFFNSLVLSIRDDFSDQDDRVKRGYDPEVDRLRTEATDVDAYLLDYQQKIATHTGVPVKVKYVTNQGYVLEVTPKDVGRFESFLNKENELLHCTRSQTLKTGQRYVSAYLLQIQERMHDALTALHTSQNTLVGNLLDQRIHVESTRLTISDTLAEIDISSSMALFAYAHQWTKPILTPGFDIEIIGGRHPLVEHFLSVKQSFVPNDLVLKESDFFHLITGPNMGGKSTYMRQQAIIILLAHAGLRVPARSATISVCDGLYARIGSGDIIAAQQSTFMTEMIETAAILHNATHRSCIIIDELGRGTSTYDGMALAKAIIVYICQHIKAKTLFATHYHELMELDTHLSGFSNRHVSVYETEREVVFLKKILPGGTDKSYGIYVAEIAGIPVDVLDLAKNYLMQLQETVGASSPVQASLGLQFQSDHPDYKKLQDTYASLDTNTLTPIEGLQILADILDILKRK